MPPKIVLNSQMINFVNELYKQLKANSLNLRENLPYLFNSEYGLTLSYSKLSSYVNVNCVVPEDIIVKVSKLSKFIN